MAQDGAAPWPFVPARRMVEIDRTEGAYLYTRDGRKLLDAAGGAIVINIGHGREEVVEAHANALARTSYAVPPFATEDRLKLVERLRKHWLPAHLTRVHLSSGGSEANEAAIRLARQYQVARGEESRWKVIGRDVSYHGTTLATLAVGGHISRRRAFEPMLLPMPHAPACYCLRCPLGKTYPGCGIACAEALEEIILREGPETVAAFMAEPIVGSSGGAIVPPDEYWPKIEEICRRHGILLIIDEVMTGFGRTGKRFGVEHWNIGADILVSGKGLTGGYAPLVGLYATDEVAETIARAGDSVMFYTYGGHPAACAAADKVLEIMEREALVERAATLGEELGRKLGRLGNHPHIADIRGRGLLWALEIVRDRDSLEPYPAEAGVTTKVSAAALEEDVVFYPGGIGTVRDIIVLGPPFIIGSAEIDRMVDVLEHAIDSAIGRVENG